MNKHLCLFYAYLLIACSVNFNASAQQPKNLYARFIKETANLRDDTNKVLHCLDFVKSHESYLQDSDLYILSQAKALSVKLNYPKGLMLSGYMQGSFAEIRKNFPLAISNYKESVRIAERNKWYGDIYLAYSAMLNIYYYLADYPNAMDIAQKGLALAELYNNKQDEAHYINQVGFIYLKQGNTEESIKYYMQYLILAKELRNKVMIADACNGIADGYLLKNDCKAALGYFFTALDIYSKLNEDKNPEFDRKRTANRHERTAYTLFKISSAYKQAGDNNKALYYSLQIFDMYNKRKQKGLPTFNPYDLASYYINMGDIYRILKDYKKAGIFLNEGLSISKSILHREDMRDAYEVLSKNFASQKRYDSAYYYHVLFTGLKDSILNEKVSREINSLEVARRDKEIALLNQQRKLKETETARHNVTRDFFIGFITLVAVITFLLVYIQNGIKMQKLVAEKQSALQIERQRISSDMHDDIGTGLSTMLIYINMLKLKSTNKKDEQNISRIAALGTALVEQMKEIVWSLSPGNDRLDSLLLFIRQYFVLLFEPLAYETNVVFPATIPDVELKSDLRRNVFLCVKEALNNVIKHAKATSVELNVQVKHRMLTIVIKDNGSGLPLPLKENITGNGLKNITRRMNIAKGKCNILNDNGTVVSLEFELPPYPNG